MGPRQKYPYWEWEDYHAGLYSLDEVDGTTSDAVEVLRSPRLMELMQAAVKEYPKAAAHHLTDDGLNQRAWLGWAACLLAKQVPSHRTRSAWWQLTEDERGEANAVADRVIKLFRSSYAQTLFDDERAS